MVYYSELTQPQLAELYQKECDKFSKFCHTHTCSCGCGEFLWHWNKSKYHNQNVLYYKWRDELAEMKKMLEEYASKI